MKTANLGLPLNHERHSGTRDWMAEVILLLDDIIGKQADTIAAQAATIADHEARITALEP